MPASKIQLTHEVDFTPTVKGAEKMERQFLDTHKRMDRAVTETSSVIIRGVRKRGDVAKRSLDRTRGSLRGLERGFGLAAVSASGFQQSLSGSVREILLSATSMGLLGGALAAAGIGFALLTRGSGPTALAFDRRFESMTKRLSDLRAESSKLDRDLKRQRGVNLFAEDADKARTAFLKLDARLVNVRRSLQRLKRDRQGFILVPGERPEGKDRAGFSLDEARKLRDQLEKETKTARGIAEGTRGVRDRTASVLAIEDEKRVKALNKLVKERLEMLQARTAFKRLELGLDRDMAKLVEDGVPIDRAKQLIDAQRLDFFKKMEKPLAAQTKALQDQIAIMNELEPKERERLALNQQIKAMLERIKIPESASEDLQRIAANLRKTIEELRKSGVQAIDRDFPSRFTRFSENAGQEFGAALTAGLTEALLGGDSKAIAKQFGALMLNQLIGLGIGGFGTSSQAGSGLLGLFSFAHEGFAARPMAAVVGDDPGGEGEFILTPSTLRKLMSRGGGQPVTVQVFNRAEISAGDVLDNARSSSGPGFRMFTQFHEPQNSIERRRLSGRR